MFGNFNIDVIVVGKMKEKSLLELQKEYQKKLSGYVKLNVVELKDEDDKKGIDYCLKTEGLRILNVIDENSYVVVMDIGGTQFTSEAFADKIEEIVTYSNSKITFIIGGSNGIAEEIKKNSKLKISFSKMTFPHQLFRIILLEQIYRSFRIKNNAPYHK